MTTARRAEASSLERLDTADALSSVEDEPRDRALDRVNRRLLLEQRSNGAAIQPAIALRAGSPDRGSLATVEHAELQARRDRSREP